MVVSVADIVPHRRSNVQRRKGTEEEKRLGHSRRARVVIRGRIGYDWIPHCLALAEGCDACVIAASAKMETSGPAS